MKQASVAVVAKEQVGQYTWLRVSGSGTGIELRPGQFCMVRCGSAWSPYLRRSLFPAQIGSGEWVWAFRSAGDAGLAWLATREPGAELDCLAPCGNGFELQPEAHNLLIVAEP